MLGTRDILALLGIIERAELLIRRIDAERRSVDRKSVLAREERSKQCARAQAARDRYRRLQSGPRRVKQAARVGYPEAVGTMLVEPLSKVTRED